MAPEIRCDREHDNCAQTFSSTLGSGLPHNATARPKHWRRNDTGPG